VEVHEAMSSRKFLLPLAGLLVIGLAIAGWTARPAQAGVGTITPSTTTPTINVPMSLTVTFDGSTTVGSVNTLFASSGIFSAGSVSPTETVGGLNTSTLTFSAGVAGAHTLTATYTCTVAGSVSITASQSPGTPPSNGIVVTCGGAVTTGLTVNPPTAGLNTQVQVSGTCTAGGQALIASGGGSFGTVPPPTNGQINTPTSVVCSAPGAITAYFYCNTAIAITFTLGTSQGSLNCAAAQTAGGITATPPSVGVNQTATISGNCVGSQTVTASGGGIFQAVVTGAQYSTQNQLICSGGVFSATFLCGPQPVQVTFSSGTQTGTLGCGVAGAGGLALNPPTAGTTTTVTGQCVTPGQQLTVTGTGTFVGAQINTSPVPNVVGTTVVNCTSVGTLMAQFNCTAPGVASFNLAGVTGTFQCTTGGTTCIPPAVLNPATGQCSAPFGGGVPASVTISANPSSLQCTGSSSVAFMSVSVKDAQGQNAQDGTTVTITADSGTFAPSQATTSGGSTQFIYSPASTSSGTVNIRANAGAAQGQATVNVTCGATSAPPPVSAPVTSPPPPPTGPVTIQPPNTGDAGLATPTDGTNWQLYAATAILVAVASGAIALVRTKA